MTGQNTEEYTEQNCLTFRDMFIAISFYGRGAALFFGVFTLLNLLARLRYPGFDANIWWVDFRYFLPASISNIFLLLSGILFVAFVIKPVMCRWRKFLTFLCIAVLYAACWINVVVYYVLLFKGRFEAGIPIPVSLFISMGCEIVGISVLCNGKCISIQRQKERLLTLSTFLALFLLFPLLQIFLFGKTDYSRRADAAVIFGARVYSDGTLSLAAEDRVRTGCNLYRKGLVKFVVFSGGPGDGDIHETQGMQKLAMELGVDPGAILVDRNGFNTRATVENTVRIFREKNINSALAVSHYYHLPRIKMCYQSRGWEVYTVPADQQRSLKKITYFIFREIAAIWAYYFQVFMP